jgi:hypothetical protein
MKNDDETWKTNNCSSKSVAATRLALKNMVNYTLA